MTVWAVDDAPTAPPTSARPQRVAAGLPEHLAALTLR